MLTLGTFGNYSHGMIRLYRQGAPDTVLSVNVSFLCGSLDAGSSIVTCSPTLVRARDPVSCAVNLCDANGNCLCPLQSLPLIVQDHPSTVFSLARDGTYKFSVQFTSAGDASITLRLGGIPLRSFVTIVVLAGPPDPSKSRGTITSPGPNIAGVPIGYVWLG